MTTSEFFSCNCECLSLEVIIMIIILNGLAATDRDRSERELESRKSNLLTPKEYLFFENDLQRFRSVGRSFVGGH